MAYSTQNAKRGIFKTKLTANDATAQEVLGAIRELADGRKFRYMRMTGSAGALGKLVMPATKVTVTNATSATAVGPDGANTTIITDPDATWTVNAYVGWYYQTATAMTGSTEPIKILGNTATTLTLEKQITTALATAGTDDGEIIAGTAAAILSTASDLDLPITGAGIAAITENYYGWFQVSGIAAVYSDAITEGLAVSSGGDAAGKAVARAGADDNYIGVCIAASGTGEYSLVDLCIA